MSIDAQTSLPCATRSAAAVYNATPLPIEYSDNIRLLKIISGDEHTPISCALHVASFDDLPAYEALSYMWGDEAATESIILNGQAIPVRPNLWEFLHQQRREQGADSEGKYLWIDALCINQECTLEKNHQVAMMGEIYIEASTVRIWLGVGTESLFRAMALLERIDEDEEAEIFENVAYEDVALLCEHPYWSRAWILQECVLAERLVLQCGPAQVSSYSIVRLYLSPYKLWDLRIANGELVYPNEELEDINEKPGKVNEEPEEVDEELGVVEDHLSDADTTLISADSCQSSRSNFAGSPAIRVLQARGSYDPSQQLYYYPWTNFKLLVRCLHPRDRIYAMISLMDPDKPKIIPDYGASDEAVFLEVVDKLVEWGPKRADHVGYVAVMLELIRFDLPPKEWSPVVLLKLMEAHSSVQGA